MDPRTWQALLDYMRMLSMQAPAKLSPFENPQQERAFRAWYAQMFPHLNPNPDAPQHFYDYRRAYQSGMKLDSSGHGMSEFKLQGHPREWLPQGDFWLNTRTGDVMSRVAP